MCNGMFAGLRLAVAALFAWGVPAAARATVLTFEDLDPGYATQAALPPSYAGFTWSNVRYAARPSPGMKLDANHSLFVGTNGLVSVHSVVEPWGPLPVPGWEPSPLPVIVAREHRFTFRGAYLTSLAWGQLVDVEGWQAGTRVFAQTIEVVGEPRWFEFDYADIDELRLAPRRGAIVIDELQYVDHVPPSIWLWPPSQVTVSDRLFIQGCANDRSGLVPGSLVVRSGDVVVPAQFSPRPDGGCFSAVVPLAEGDNGVTVQVTDQDGNVGSQVVHYTRDTLPPVIEIVSPLPGSTVASCTFPVTVKVTDSSDVSVRFNVGAPIRAVDGLVSATIWSWCVDGTATVNVEAADYFSRRTTASFQFVVDRSLPQVTLDVADGSRFGPLPGDLLPIRITVVDESSTTVYAGGGAPLPLPLGGGSVSVEVPLVEGVNPVRVTVVDAGSRQTFVSVNVIYDTTSPAVEVSGPVEGSFVSGVVAIAARATDATSGVRSLRVLANGVELAACAGDGPCAGSLDTTVDTTTLLDGPLTVACTATDLAGNVATESATVTIRNWRLDPAPAVLHLGAGSGGTVTLAVEGPNVALLVPASAHGLSLVVPDGPPVPLDPRGGSEQTGDSDRDGIPDVVLKFDRGALVSALEGGIAAGLVVPGEPVEVGLVTADGRRLGATTIEVR